MFFGGEVAGGKGILGGPPPNFYTELDFWNGLEHIWGGGGGGAPLNYATEPSYKRHLFRQHHSFQIKIPYDINHCSTNLSLVCREPGSAWALEKAKENLVHNYLVVGVTERLTEFVAVMEVVLPRFFKGATKRFILGM